MKTSTSPISRDTDIFTPSFQSPAPTDAEQARKVAEIKAWCLARADEWYAKGELGAARDFLHHAAEVDPRDVQVLIALGSLYYEAGDYEHAGLAFNQAGRLDATNALIFLRLGLTHQQLGQFEEAEALLKHALALRPDNALALSLLGEFMCARERYAEARGFVESAMQDQPNNPELLLRLGLCCFKTNDLKAAQACFERVLKLDPANETARENLAVLKHESR